ncbi:MAG: diaminopimelate decarboxylase [Chloroherpetonaceae bacterium]|nr:diaminopimelate decarboxylase [Chthonomonadaceae bacterium]MDW8208205.1 diaminopimelate decarboxylase [Chloroherpetonaceae bacterium]
MLLLGTQQVNAQGHLEIGGCDAVELARQFGTPLYVVDEAAVRENCRAYRAAFDACYPRNRIYYASKAFLTCAMAGLIAQEGLFLDVASLGELYVARHAGFPPDRIALHGNNKSWQELDAAFEHRIGHIIVDNFLELEMLGVLARNRKETMEVLVRATPGVDPQTHHLIRTGQADTKFGFNIADGSAMEAVRRVLTTPGLRFRGIHCHIGSQLLDADTHREAALVMVELMQKIHAETGALVEELNIGGGLGVRYLPEHQPPDFRAFAGAVARPLRKALDDAGLPYPILSQEPGRSLVGEAGVTLYTVGAIKTVPITEPPGTRTYVAVDGGLSDNPRPQMYQAVYSCVLANRANQPADRIYTIAGKHCETDILIRDTMLPEMHTGDVLAVQTTGAYNQAMASNYNRFLRPAVVFVMNGRADLVVSRETLDDLVRHEILPDRLRPLQSA